LSEVRALLGGAKDSTGGDQGGGAAAFLRVRGAVADDPAPAPAPAPKAAGPVPPAVREYEKRMAFNRGKKPDPNQPTGPRFDWKAHQARQAGPVPQEAADSGEYNDANEVDRTTMQGHVTQVGDRISKLVDVVRGEVIETATAESDVEEETWQREYEKAFGCPPPMEKLYDDEVQGMAGWYEGDVDRERELERAKAQGWLDQPSAATAPLPAAAPAAAASPRAEEEEEEEEDMDLSPQV